MRSHDVLVRGYLLAWLGSFVVPIDSDGRAKRIIGGSPLPSHDTYKTYSYAHIRRSWACTHDQTTHDLTPCQEDYSRCSAALIHPEFVITSALCLMYYEVLLKYAGRQLDDWEEHRLIHGEDSIWEDVSDFAKEAWKVIAYVVVPKPQHTIYSDWSIYVGSATALKMTQKRHVVSVYPHAKYPILDKNDKEELVSFKDIVNSYHDVGVLRACEPFKLKLGQVEVVNMMRDTARLQKHYEDIVRRGTVCLYIGLGHVRFDQWSFSGEYIYSGDYIQHEEYYKLLHAWRSSMCNSYCNADRLLPDTKPHTCILCSKQLGATLSIPTEADYGSPVTCEGWVVATVSRADSDKDKNITRTGSYPFHCVYNSINNDRLKYYKSLPLDGYHPLVPRRLRRLPIPPESHS